eukprot:CAMPEP_0115401872 /NCGR_PEP_ID=MMETSP0271-20121206/16116_1 /TAXON_ID=71861 /ORGANISM="Scrippsiella trochoidea, Strain CCMP3099" /LENGTH=36 /DNA_ID= /DNA_START= /DNA_END= /DNA_ORIENTATION=
MKPAPSHKSVADPAPEEESESEAERSYPVDGCGLHI